MPFPKAKRVSLYQDATTGQALKRLTDSEGKLNPEAVRYETDQKNKHGGPIVAYFVPLAKSEPEKK